MFNQNPSPNDDQRKLTDEDIKVCVPVGAAETFVFKKESFTTTYEELKELLLDLCSQVQVFCEHFEDPKFNAFSSIFTISLVDPDEVFYNEGGFGILDLNPADFAEVIQKYKEHGVTFRAEALGMVKYCQNERLKRLEEKFQAITEQGRIQEELTVNIHIEYSAVSDWV